MTQSEPPQFPEDEPLSIEDFRRCGWQKAIEGADNQDYYPMNLSLRAASDQAIEAGKRGERKVLKLLADACSLRLDLSNSAQPYKTFMIVGDRRSASLEDFGNNEAIFFSQIAEEEITEPKFCARIADLSWVLSKNLKHALLAIDSYVQIPIDYTHENCQCWQRAIQLCRMLGLKGKDKLEEIKQRLYEAAHRFDKDSHTLQRILLLLLKCGVRPKTE